MRLKVGMRVRCRVEVGDKHLKDQVGTIIGIRRHGGVSVEFDNHIRGHSASVAGFNGKNGHCWNLSPEVLEPLELTPDQAFDQYIKGHITEEAYKEAVESHGN